MAPEAAEPGSLEAEHSQKSFNFWFGVVNCIGVLAAIITLLKSFNWRRRHSIAVASAASAPAGAILNRAVNMAQTLTVLRYVAKPNTAKWWWHVVKRKEITHREGLCASMHNVIVLTTSRYIMTS